MGLLRGLSVGTVSREARLYVVSRLSSRAAGVSKASASTVLRSRSLVDRLSTPVSSKSNGII